ncbi:MAG: hypothetical protein IKE89_06040, partial [Bacilli bacterium]|nr:hypothetical protein [Bacilli bacterium]
MRNMKKIRIRKGILILGIVILVMAIGFFNRKYFSHEIAKQDYMDPVYGEGSLDGWKFQFDMYTNNPGENAVDKTNSVSTIEHEFQSESEYKYITFQISYTYTGQDSFAPGTLKIYVPKYKEGSRDITYELISPTINIAAGSLADGYEWNYSSQIIDNNSYYVFTNNKQLAVEEGKDNLQGMFQIAYAIEAEDVYIRYDSTTQQEKPSYKEFNAKLVNTVDDNSLTSDTKKVTLDFPKATYKIRKSANKIKSLDGLPSDDYIWVNYKITSSKTNGLRGIFRAVFGDFQDIFLIKETLPSENCILLDDKMNEITSDSNDYYIKSLSHEDAGDLNPQWSFYIGYPISEFDGETITNTAQFYGQYTDATLDYNYYKDLDKYTHEVEYIAEDSIEVDLNKFKFVYPPGNYGLVKHVYSSANTYYKQHDSETMDFKKIKEASDRNTFFIRPITNYTGTTLTVRIGDDREYIESADGTKKEWLSDNDYYFSYINLPILKNGNGNPIKTYQAKLFVRYAGTNNYVLYSNNDDSNAGIFDTSARKEFNFNETNIVGWYIEIYNMKESIKDAVSLSTRVNYSKEDIGNIGTKGYLYNFAYFDVYDDQGNLLNGASESSYTGTGYNDGLAQWDYETYGHYPRRDYAYVKYNYPKEGYYIYKSKRGEKYELDRWKAEFYFRPYHIDSYGYKRDTPFTKIDMYDLLPAGMYLESPIINVNRYYDYKNYTINGEKPSSNDELIEFLKSHTSYEIKYNWNNTGRTWIHVYSDFTDV